MRLKNNQKGETFVTIIFSMMMIMVLTIGALEMIDNTKFQSKKNYALDAGTNVTISVLNEVRRRFLAGDFESKEEAVVETDLDTKTSAVTYITFQEFTLSDTADITDFNYVGIPDLIYNENSRKSWIISAYTYINNRRVGASLKMVVTER